MTNINRFNKFFGELNITNELTTHFEKLLKDSSEKDLDIADKNICIDFENVEYKKTEFNFHSFQCLIFKDQNNIGYYAIIYDEHAKLIDELFVIFS